MAHNGEVVSYQGTSSLHVARFAKRSEADAAFDALGFHYASVLFKKDSHGWWSVAKTYGLHGARSGTASSGGPCGPTRSSTARSAASPAS